MDFRYIKNDKELVVTWYEGDDQMQIIIADDAVYTGEDSDRQFHDYPQWAYELKSWINEKRS